MCACIWGRAINRMSCRNRCQNSAGVATVFPMASPWTSGGFGAQDWLARKTCSAKCSFNTSGSRTSKPKLRLEPSRAQASLAPEADFIAHQLKQQMNFPTAVTVWDEDNTFSYFRKRRILLQRGFKNRCGGDQPLDLQ